MLPDLPELTAGSIVELKGEDGRWVVRFVSKQFPPHSSVTASSGRVWFSCEQDETKLKKIAISSHNIKRVIKY